MTIHVFLGPSIPLREAREILEGAVYHPPVAMGDVYAVTSGATAIAIIDGYFDKTPAVWHKEILFALESGVPVLGASSMGALRAAELCSFGMQGVGEVFEAYRSGEIEDDDEVALFHGPAESGYVHFSAPLVNVRATLRLAEERGIVEAAEHRALVDIMKRRFYRDRTWPGLVEDAGTLGFDAERRSCFAAFVRSEAVDVKRRDAAELLRRIAAGRELAVKLPEPGFHVERTSFWSRLVESTSRVLPASSTGSDASWVRMDQVLSYARFAMKNREDVVRGTLLSYLVVREAERLGISPTTAEVSAAATRLRRRRRLFSVEATEAWLRDNDLTRAEMAQMARVDALIDKLLHYHANEIARLLPLSLKRAGELTTLARESSEKLAFLRSRGLENPTFEDAGVTAEQLFDWYAARHRELEEPAEEHAGRLGYPSLRDLLTELLGTLLWERGSARSDAAGETR